MVSFFVHGNPAPKGSMRAIPYRNGRRLGVAVMHDNPRTKLWAHTVAVEARRAIGARRKFQGAVKVQIYFYMPRPKTNKSDLPTAKRDIDKLARAVLDALTGVCWIDDGQVVDLSATKQWADDSGERVAGAYVILREVEGCCDEQG